MKSFPNKYHSKTILPIWHKTVRCFDFMIVASQKLTIVFHAEFQNWHWSCQWHPTIHFFPLTWKEYFNWWADTTVGPLCGRVLLIFEPQHIYNILHYSLSLYFFSFSFSMCWFHGYPWWENEDVFQKMKYIGVLTSFTQQGNQIKVLFFNVVPNCALKNVN